MGKNPVIINKVVTIIFEQAREKTWVRYMLLISAMVGIITFTFYVTNGVYNWVNNNFLLPRRIYLNLIKGDKKMPLKSNHTLVPIFEEIKKDIPVVLKFRLTQDNKDSPEITTIFIDFPTTADVSPISYNRWSWIRTNAPANQYSLDCSYFRFAKGADWDLPAFNVTFKDVDLLYFTYSIIGSGVNEIRRTFIIGDPAKYQQTNSSILDVSSLVIETPDIYNTATPPTVKVESFVIQNTEEIE
ncbi:MAG: hypothetical protein KKC39_01005 [Candidatus Omnitrophica bacterium]|nr:hypothetical protein [Candidatus Omnitrophota bacterium]MCG2707429.1 hypothetical protein [Candidatus Omnitrophota bacterium]